MRLHAVVVAHGMTVVAVIDLAAEASVSGVAVPDTVLVLLGDASIVAPIVVADPMSALDLPFKVLVRADGLETRVTYPTSASLGADHSVTSALTAAVAQFGDVVDVALDR